MLINQRVKIIISELDKTNEILTGQYFSKLLAVTTRTIRNDIKVFNEAFGKSEHIIQSVKGSGYILNEKYRKDIKSIVNLHPDYVKPIEPLDRIDKICELLFSHDVDLTIELLEQTLFVSESTLLRDLINVKNYFKTFDLKIQISDYIQLVGQEENIRRAMLAFILDKDFTQHHFQMIKQDLHDMMRHALNKQKIYLSDQQLKHLILKMTIIVYRYKTSDKLEHNIDKRKSPIEFIQTILDDIHQKYPINQIDEQALVHIIEMHLIDQKQLNDMQKDAVTKALDVTCKTFDVSFSKNVYQILEKGLINNQYDIYDHHQFSHIKLEYPLAFEIAMFFSDELANALNINISQLSILRMIFVFLNDLEQQSQEVISQRKKVVLISHLDHYQNQYLKQKILFSFPSFEIIEILPVYFNSDGISLETDFILSTKSIAYEDKTVIVINPFLKAYDILKIKTHMKDLYYKRMVRFDLINHFREGLFFKVKDIKNQFDLIEYLVKPLVKTYGASKDLFESMIKRESVSSTYIGNFVAIPHAIDSNHGENLIAIAILDKPIDWFDQKVQVIFLIDIKNPKEQHIEHMFHQLYQVIQNDKLIQKLTKTQNYYEFIKVMNERRTT